VGATWTDTLPMRRAGMAGELANLAAFLLSDACDYHTGQTIAMDGGQMLAGPNAFAGLTSLSEQAWAAIRDAAGPPAPPATSSAPSDSRRP
jgi:NAD(P)-dependent dehydrogenase (short-subunit alcohol dehydrogenase family)